MTIKSFGLVLDNGVLWGGFSDREDAHLQAIVHNARVMQARARGDLVTMRRAIGVVKITWKKPKLTKPTKPHRKKKAHIKSAGADL